MEVEDLSDLATPRLIMLGNHAETLCAHDVPPLAKALAARLDIVGHNLERLRLAVANLLRPDSPHTWDHALQGLVDMTTALCGLDDNERLP